MTLQNENRYWYGLRARPISTGALPAGQVECLDFDEAAQVLAVFIHDENDIRHGAVAYAAPLPAAQVHDYELVDLATKLAKLKQMQAVSDDLIQRLIDLIPRNGITADDETLKRLVRDAFSQFSLSDYREKHPLSLNREDDPDSYNVLLVASSKVSMKMVIERLKSQGNVADATEDSQQMSRKAHKPKQYRT